jgi:hypothetical protein
VGLEQTAQIELHKAIAAVGLEGAAILFHFGRADCCNLM